MMTAVLIITLSVSMASKFGKFIHANGSSMYKINTKRSQNKNKIFLDQLSKGVSVRCELISEST